MLCWSAITILRLGGSFGNSSLFCSRGVVLVFLARSQQGPDIPGSSLRVSYPNQSSLNVRSSFNFSFHSRKSCTGLFRWFWSNLGYSFQSKAPAHSSHIGWFTSLLEEYQKYLFQGIRRDRIWSVCFARLRRQPSTVPVPQSLHLPMKHQADYRGPAAVFPCYSMVSRNG